MTRPHSKAILALAFLCATLVGCTDSSITAVKKASLAQSDFTFGEALDDVKGCKSTEWSHHDDGNGRSIVEYTCTAEISSAQVDQAKTDNTERIKALTKKLDVIWTDSLAGLEQHKNTVEQEAIRAHGENDSKLQEARARRQYLQKVMDAILADAATASADQAAGKRISPFFSEHLRIDTASTKFAIAGADAQIAALEKARDNPTAGPSMGNNPYKSVPEYQHMMDGMLAWKERYYAAVAEKQATETKRAQDFIAGAKDRKLQLKITFLVNKKSPVDLRSAKWVSEDQVETAPNSAYLAAVLLDPNRMQQAVDEAVKSRLKFPLSNFDATESFPIVCGDKVPEGCELRKSGS